MKFSITLSALLMCVAFSYAQNLIPNPSFEDHDTCPNTVSQLYYCLGWEQILQTADYYNSCGFGDGDVPSNYFGIQCPNTGNAYAGSICYYKNAGPHAREIIGTQFLTPLVVGQKYYCTYHLNLSSKVTSATGVNKYGFKLSTVPFIHDTSLIDNNPFMYSDSVVIDTAGWVQFKYSFTADSGYQYIALGVFFEDSLLTIDYTWTPGHFSYYYIDDVCLSVDSLTCNFQVTSPCFPTGIDEHTLSELINLYPSPLSEFLNVETNTNEVLELRLFNSIGRRVLTTNVIFSEKINTQMLASGFYYYTIAHKNKVIKSGKVIKE